MSRVASPLADPPASPGRPGSPALPEQPGLTGLPGLPGLTGLAELPGLEPGWSRYVEAPDSQGVPRLCHVLDTGDAESDGRGVLLCVHGNPTWSYLWRRFLATVRPGWRVVAVDQLGMGYSEAPSGSLDSPRSLAERIDDLTGLTDALGLGPDGPPVVVAGHDWGGIIASGWALRHRERGGRVAGLVLANTAVQHDFSTGLPRPLRFATSPGLLAAATVRTPAFVRAAAGLSQPRLPRDVRDAFAAPYPRPRDREFVGQFVADIPAAADHPTGPVLDAIAAGLTDFSDVPALLLRGPRDPVFSEEHLRDLRRRLPHASVHRYEGAGHLVTEDAPRTASDVWRWIGQVVEPALAGTSTGSGPPDDTGLSAHEGPAWARLLDRVAATPDELAVAEVRSGRRMTFAQFESDVAAVAAGLAAHGVRPGERVALLVPPGIDLTVAVYACWRLGAVIVVADAGLGLPGMGRALRGAGPAHVVGIAKGLAAIAAMGVPGRRILAADPAGGALDARLGRTVSRVVGVEATLDGVRAAGRAAIEAGTAPADQPYRGEADAAVLFTSGATGPAKGVVYRAEQLRAQAEHVRAIYGLTSADRFVAAFAPFALYGPAMGVGSVVPDMDVTAPSTLDAAGLADAVLAADATTVFASPASLRTIVATADRLDERRRDALARVRVAMSAGAPIPVAMMREVAEVLPNAELHTPYGMTECLPVSDIVLAELETVAAGPVDGVCVGRPLPGVRVRVAPLPDEPSGAHGEPTDSPWVTGEILVSAAHVKDRYDQLWATQAESARDGLGPHGPWHRTGDVGHLDDDGRLWVQGRRVHVVHTAVGPLPPVAIEQAVLALPGVADAALVGVGPSGAQAPVVVVRPEAAPTGRFAAALPALVPEAVAARVRATALAAEPRLAPPSGPGIAAVLQTAHFPVDIRHQSKVDRTRLAGWAERALAGGRVGRP